MAKHDSQQNSGSVRYIVAGLHFPFLIYNDNMQIFGLVYFSFICLVPLVVCPLICALGGDRE